MKKKLLQISLVLFSLNLSAQIPTSGLLGLWTFTGNANDQSGNNYHGTVGGASLSTDRASNSNAAYQFNGIADSIFVNDVYPLRLANTDYSISVWINAFSLPATPSSIISKRTGSGNNGYILNLAGSASAIPGQINFNISGGTDPKAVSHSTVSLNAWHHIVIVYNLSTQRVRIYLDGNLDADTTGIPAPNGSANSVLGIGVDAAGNGYYFNGKIDDIAMYNRALTPAEVQQLYSIAVGIESVTQRPAIEVFPNPVTEYFTVTNLQLGEIKIYNPLGNLVKSATIDKNNFRINISELPDGIYFVHIAANDRKNIIEKIIKN